MLAETLLVALVDVASADIIPPRAVRQLQDIKGRDTTTSFQPATTDNAERAACSSKYTALFSDAPKAPFEYLDFAGCGGLPSSLTAAASSYQATALIWADAHSAELESLQNACFSEATPVTNTYIPICTYTGSDIAKFVSTEGPYAFETTPAPTSTPAVTTNGTAGGGAAGTNAGSRGTGLAWAAAGIAGVLGAVALL